MEPLSPSRPDPSSARDGSAGRSTVVDVRTGTDDRLQPVAGAPTGPVFRTLAAAVGATPVLRIAEPFAGNGRGFWAKLEGWNPGGMKDRPALHMVATARSRGELAPGAPIVESTSGTMGLGLALAGIVYQHPVTIVVDPGVEPSVVQLLRAHNVRVETVRQPHPTGGWQEARRARVREIVAELPGAWWPNQGDNPDNGDAYESLADELIGQVGDVDVLVCSVGTGGHSAGVSRALRRVAPGLRVIGVDAVGSCLFGQPSRDRLIRGMGNSIHPDNVDYEVFDEVHWVAPSEVVWMCRALARHCFVSGGWSTGAVGLVAAWAARTGDPSAQVVAVFPDRLWRYSDTIYDDEFCRRHRLLGGSPPDGPEELSKPGDHEVLRWSRCPNVIDPRRLSGPRRTPCA